MAHSSRASKSTETTASATLLVSQKLLTDGLADPEPTPCYASR